MNEPNLPEQPFSEQGWPPQPIPQQPADDSSRENVGEVIANGLDMGGEVVSGGVEVVGEVVSGGVEIVGEVAGNVLGEAASGCAGCSLVLAILLVTASAALAVAW